MSVQGRLRRSDGIIHRDVVGETFLVPVRGRLADLEDIFLVNEAGAWIWERLSRPCHADEIVTDMMREFSVDEERAREDVDVFLSQLLDAHLLDVVGESEGG